MRVKNMTKNVINMYLRSHSFREQKALCILVEFWLFPSEAGDSPNRIPHEIWLRFFRISNILEFLALILLKYTRNSKDLSVEVPFVIFDINSFISWGLETLVATSEWKREAPESQRPGNWVKVANVTFVMVTKMANLLIKVSLFDFKRLAVARKCKTSENVYFKFKIFVAASFITTVGWRNMDVQSVMWKWQLMTQIIILQWIFRMKSLVKEKPTSKN